ncbi:hypothetical protein LRS13_25310 [Svornostia abyssi]|uniref:Uncharacterized protein n=1 Tax=Svornostia abyssi TaxID=2898438 RepID=A0ABY5PH81_9ACTN|nr:hypothetical protein LRS13_25310 [Parviterribacteraceae bacterium J379]
MPFRPLVLAVLILAIVPAGASAASIPRIDDLPSACGGSANMSGTAYACDPEGQACEEFGGWCSEVPRGAEGVSLTLGSERRARRRGILYVGSGEELQPGETVELRWRRPSSRAVLAVVAAGAKVSRTIVLALRWRPTWVRVTANEDGSVTVTTARVSGVIAPEVWPDVTWRERSAIGAAHRILRALSLRRDLWTSLRRVCAALAPGVGEYFARDVVDDDGVEVCPIPLYFAVVGGDNVPHVRRTDHAATRVRVKGDRAVLSTRLTHRFGDQRRPSTVTARALLLRGADGIWSLATPLRLFALGTLDDTTPYTDAQLRGEFTRMVAEGRREAASRARTRAAFEAATVTGDAPQPCRPATRPDPRGDVMISGDALARHQRDHLDVDLVELGVSATCVLIRTAGPLPVRFTLRASALEITVKDGRVLATTGDRSYDAKPVRGIVAHLEPSLFVLRTPTKHRADGSIDLSVGRDDEYHDTDWVPVRSTR